MRDTAASCKIGRLKRRADFLRAAKGKRWHATPMSVQAATSDEPGVRIGLTLTRKVGNAVVRNRIRRRLREAVRVTDALPVVPGHDYVIIGRVEALRLPFETLQRDLARALRGVHESGRPGGRRSRTEKRSGELRHSAEKD
jgi:ribonuclease P protein component